jgi:hypothetical protein
MERTPVIRDFSSRRIVAFFEIRETTAEITKETKIRKPSASSVRDIIARIKIMTSGGAPAIKRA